jgi:hypothetical protein
VQTSIKLEDRNTVFSVPGSTFRDHVDAVFLVPPSSLLEDREAVS